MDRESDEGKSMKKLKAIIRPAKHVDLPIVFHLARVDELRAANITMQSSGGSVHF
jgi:hypothetical protein